MRFPILLVAGLVCILAGVSMAEWTRRHPADKTGSTPEASKATLEPLTDEELIRTEPPETLEPDADAVAKANADLAEQTHSVALPPDIQLPEVSALLGGSLFARNAIGLGNALFLALEEGKQGSKQTLVRFTHDGPPSALAVHRPGVGALAPSGDRLFWSEGGCIYSVDAVKGGAARGQIKFARARITSLAARDGALVATLVPQGLDPFSSDPVGAVVAIKDGRALLLASKQVRPAEIATDGAVAVWVAGYPANLLSARLDSHEVKTLAARADGPVLLDSKGVYFRHPAVGSTELQQLGWSDSEPHAIAKGEVDRVTQFGSDLWYSVGGSVHWVASAGGQDKEVARLPRAILELAATDDALYVVTRQEAGGHLLLRLPRSSPEGSRP